MRSFEEFLSRAEMRPIDLAITFRGVVKVVEGLPHEMVEACDPK